MSQQISIKILGFFLDGLMPDWKIESFVIDFSKIATVGRHG
jgi:hypothetical protein